MSDKETQRIRDPVHGLIVFGGGNDAHQNETDRIAWRLLNTREFQRLRRIRQLGFSDLVYPGATHSRLAHAIGVYHTARRLIEVIRRRQDETHEDKERERVVLLAALLHDIGHGPFSHVFEHAPYAAKRHEDWGAEIVQGETEVNQVSREVDEVLPEHIGALLKEDTPKDFYATVVSSQFDADRLDYVQRDRLMTGVEFAHLDCSWLLDCLEAGPVTIEMDGPVEVQCLYLNFKGVQVAEEYLEARFRLYKAVYMHKTTRGAEKMFEALLRICMKDLREDKWVQQDPVLNFLMSESPSLSSYLKLDDASVWATVAALASSSQTNIAELASRLRNRRLYKCLDIGIRDKPQGNLYTRSRRKLRADYKEYDSLLLDDAEVVFYRWYDFDDSSALNKVLVKTRAEDQEPRDIANVSPIVPALRDAERIQRVYAPDQSQIEEISQIMNKL
jgi:HD superfamily phosphohydrolase